MQKHADITFQNNGFHISGDLNFSNVMSVYNKSLQLFDKHAEWVFDFSQLHSSDSAGLALIIEWIKLAKKTDKKVRFNHLPDGIVSLAKAADMDEILGSLDECCSHQG